MKNIGIVTYYKIYNYGSVWQAYALSKKCESIGFNVEIIDYLDSKQECFKKIKNKTYQNRLLCSLKSPFLFYQTIKIKLKGNQFIDNISTSQKNKFDNFIDNNLNLSKIDILKNKDYYSFFICGSDQVWQLSAPGLHELYYLRFTSKEKRIAYAPSFGSFTIPWYNKRKLKKYLMGFKNLSAREKSGVDVIKQTTGYSVPQVLDPVLLVNQEFWNELAINNVNQNHYILCYFLGDVSRYINIINYYKKHYNATLILVDSGAKNDIGADHVQPTPVEFISLIKNADFVITDSLHGSEFAIVFEKQFIILERAYITVPEQNTRLISLLDLLNLKKRYIYENNLDFVKNIQPIDYSKINDILERERILSTNYLKDSLNVNNS